MLKGLAIAGIVFALLIFVVVIASKKQPAKDYDRMIHTRFNEIETANADHGLKITCLGSDCKGGVYYFDFTSEPADLETIVRGNTATLSKIAYQNGPGSRVVVNARVAGKMRYECWGKKGAVDQCKEY